MNLGRRQYDGFGKGIKDLYCRIGQNRRKNQRLMREAQAIQSSWVPGIAT
jgi:hypothetical protein